MPVSLMIYLEPRLRGSEVEVALVTIDTLIKFCDSFREGGVRQANLDPVL